MTDELAEHDPARAKASAEHIEYADDDYDPVADRRVDGPAPDPDRYAAPAAPPRSNVKRIVMGIVGLAVSLLLLNAGLNILSQPPDSPAPSAPPPRPPTTRAAPTSAPNASTPSTTAVS